jgi:hypothetical protein
LINIKAAARRAFEKDAMRSGAIAAGKYALFKSLFNDGNQPSLYCPSSAGHQKPIIFTA